MEPIDAFIGLFSVFLILSLVVSAVAESISNICRTKPRALKRSIRSLIREDTEAFYAHEDIRRISIGRRVYKEFFANAWRWLRSNFASAERIEYPDMELDANFKRGPSYIRAEVFTDVLLDLLLNRDRAHSVTLTPAVLDQFFRQAPRPNGLPSYYPKLRKLWVQADCDVDRFNSLIQQWFEHTAERSHGHYKRKIREYLMGTGFVVATVLNADAISMFKQLLEDPTLRESRVKFATALAEREASAKAEQDDDAQREKPLPGAYGDPVSLESACRLFQISDEDCVESAVIKAGTTELLPHIGWDRVDPRYLRFPLPSRERQAQANIGDASAKGKELLVSATEAGPASSSGETAVSEQNPVQGVGGPGVQELGGEASAHRALDARQKAEADDLAGLPDDYELFWLLKLIGIGLTAAAVSLGAPFWFDLLQKLVQARGAIKSSGLVRDPISTGSPPPAEGEVTAAPAKKSSLTGVAVDQADLDSLREFNDRNYGFDLRNIYWCARLSHMAYQGSVEIERSLESIGASGCLLEDTVIDTQCLVAVTGKAVFVAFRGSEKELQDWITNADVTQRRPVWLGGSSAQLHAGFSKALDRIWPDVSRWLLEQKVVERGLPVWFTGHSLGGALATLSALRFTLELQDSKTRATVGGLHTFGQPRVGDAKCARLIDSLMPNRYTRSINQRDIVPRIPFTVEIDQIYEYEHAGRVIYFNENGTAVMDPPTWFRVLDVVDVTADRDALRSKLKEFTGDHSMSAYLKLHGRLLTSEEQKHDS